MTRPVTISRFVSPGRAAVQSGGGAEGQTERPQTAARRRQPAYGGVLKKGNGAGAKARANCSLSSPIKGKPSELDPPHNGPLGEENEDSAAFPPRLLSGPACVTGWVLLGFEDIVYCGVS